MYINSNHLKIANFILSTSNFDYRNLTDLLGIANYTLSNYLKDVEHIITKKNPSLNFNEIVTLIKEKKNILSLLRKEQHITKNEKKDYILFSLLDNDNLNLTSLADSLNISRRSLNYYLDELNIFLESEAIFLERYSNTGVFLDGDSFSKKKMLFFLCLKFLVEKNEASQELRSIVAKILYNSNYSKIAIKLKNYRLNKKENNIFINRNIFIAYLYVTKNDLKEDIEFIYQEYTNFVDDIIDKTISTSDNFEEAIRSFFALEKDNDVSFSKALKKWHAYNNFKKKYNLNDLTLNCKLIGEFPVEILNFRKYLEEKNLNLGLSESIGVYLLGKEAKRKKFENSKKYVLVYKNLHECTLFIIKSKLEKNYNFTFEAIVNYTDLNSFLKNNNNEKISIVSTEKLSFNHLKNHCIYIPLYTLI